MSRLVSAGEFGREGSRTMVRDQPHRRACAWLLSGRTCENSGPERQSALVSAARVCGMAGLRFRFLWPVLLGVRRMGTPCKGELSQRARRLGTWAMVKRV